MKFHHRVEINVPLEPLSDKLTTAQVWMGLVMRVLDPVPFVLDLEACTLLEQGERSVKRRLRFSAVEIEDEVFFEPPWRIRYVTRAQPGLPSATLIMTIEEPDTDQLAVRFDYDTGEQSSGTGIEDFYDSFRKSAYLEADIDTIGRLRVLAREGRLTPPH